MKILTPIIFIIGIILIIFTYFSLLENSPLEWKILAYMGESFGALNAFFGGMAIIGIIYTITQQNAIIKINQKDNELAKQQFIESVNQSQKQRQIEALIMLISIYEKKIDDGSQSSPNHIIPLKKKLNDLITQLENKLT